MTSRKITINREVYELITADAASFLTERLKEEDSTFFVKGKNLLGKGRFPVLSHA